MPSNKNQANYSKRPVKRVRLPKIGPRNTKSLFEEYFYWFVGAISISVMILGKAGGLSGYDAVVLGLWIAGFMWSASVLRRYWKEQAGAGRLEKSKQEVPSAPLLAKNGLPANMKPIIGPQWPLKGAPVMRKSLRPVAPAQTAQPQPPSTTPSEKKRAFVYERPTLPDRKPKFPANWAGKQDKKPKP
jgi:hypothetical protein